LYKVHCEINIYILNNAINRLKRNQVIFYEKKNKSASMFIPDANVISMFGTMSLKIKI